MKSLGHRNYRFSISWPRIFPNGTGEINQVGAFCHQLDCTQALELPGAQQVSLVHGLHPAAALAGRIRNLLPSYPLPSGAALTSTALPNPC